MDETKIILEILDILKVSALVMLVIVAPMWISFHYKSKRRELAVLTAEEQTTLEGLANLADRMEDRLATLEKILEADDPQWKDKWKDKP